MSARDPLLLALPVTLVVAACDEQDPTAVCRGDRPFQLHGGFTDAGTIAQTADDTYIPLQDFEAGVMTRIGPDCGAAAHTLQGLVLAPTPDPSIACDLSSSQLYRIDPGGQTPPRLLLPHLRCPGLPTDHGPVFDTRLADRAMWQVPDFPDDSSAVVLGHRIARAAPVGDALFHLDRDGQLARTDLLTGVREPLLAGVADFEATATHVLVRSSVDPDVAPMHVLDLATGARTYLGLYHADEDDAYSTRSNLRRAWAFDGGGRHVMHFGVYPSPLAAYDLAGRPVPFPAQARRVRARADGLYVLCDGDRVAAARPGDAEISLDLPSCNAIEFVDDHLEALVGDDLYRVPLDGAPRSLLARDIGAQRQWLDAHHLLTIRDSRLYTVVAATNLRRQHANHVWNFRSFPGRGVFYNVARGDTTDPRNGLWFLPEPQIYPTLEPCLTGVYCR